MMHNFVKQPNSAHNNCVNGCGKVGSVKTAIRIHACEHMCGYYIYIYIMYIESQHFVQILLVDRPGFRRDVFSRKLAVSQSFDSVFLVAAC